MLKSPRLSLVTPALAALLVGALGVGCTQDEPAVEEVVKAEKSDSKIDPDHEFKVDENGKVVFKAEIVYFKFDDHTLTDEGMERLNALASYLKENPSQHLSIEGHCDERGSPEYNLALGQRRSQSVKTYLASVGVSDARLATVSFGEEKPAAQGQGEEAWQQNRRAEFQLTSMPSE